MQNGPHNPPLQKEAIVNAKLFLLVVVVALLTAFAMTAAQQLIMGKTNVAITAAFTTIAVITLIRVKQKKAVPR